MQLRASYSADTKKATIIQNRNGRMACSCFLTYAIT